jgi:hypothetical protein
MQIHSTVVEHDCGKALSYPILMSAIGRSNFAWGEKALKIRDTTEDRQISKLQTQFRIEGAFEASSNASV